MGLNFNQLIVRMHKNAFTAWSTIVYYFPPPDFHEKRGGGEEDTVINCSSANTPRKQKRSKSETELETCVCCRCGSLPMALQSHS